MVGMLIVGDEAVGVAAAATTVIVTGRIFLKDVLTED